MKKTVSILLSVLMLFALCVPAFAAPQKIEAPAPKNGTTLVKTDLSELPSEDGYFTVTIPADTAIKWGSTAAVDLSYTVESHLSRAKRLNVTVDASGAMKTADGAYSIAYQLNNDGETAYHATEPVVFPAVSCPLNLTVAQAAWDTAVVETYSDTLTFNVSVVAA